MATEMQSKLNDLALKEEASVRAAKEGRCRPREERHERALSAEANGWRLGLGPTTGKRDRNVPSHDDGAIRSGWRTDVSLACCRRMDLERRQASGGGRG